MYLANTNFCLYHRECAALKSTLQLSSLIQHHLLDRHPGVERFACHATGYTRKGTTGAMREAIPEGNNGRDEGSPSRCQFRGWNALFLLFIPGIRIGVIQPA